MEEGRGREGDEGRKREEGGGGNSHTLFHIIIHIIQHPRTLVRITLLI